LLRNALFEDHEVDFVDGSRVGGWLTLGLPVVNVLHCGAAGPIESPEAEVELRVLKDGRTKDGVRIIGYVERYDWEHPPEPARGIKVVVKGPSGELHLTTDQQGIFDVTDLPPGPYAVDLENSGGDLVEFGRTVHEDHALQAGDILGCSIQIRKAISPSPERSQ
jgi:hypothetical protein